MQCRHDYLFVLVLHVYKLLKPWLFLTECNSRSERAWHLLTR